MNKCVNQKTNSQLSDLISLLKNTSRENQSRVWRDIADRLEGPARNYAEVNLSKINRYATNGDTIIVPGKVLGSGALDLEVTVAALNFSASASEKIRKANGQCMSIQELVSANPSGSRVRVLR
jgi:large subunit ribosomal protein L18e